MTPLSSDDLPRLFATLRYAGELGEAHGQLLWDLTRDWSRGVNAASLEGRVSSSNVSDPTGRMLPDEDVHTELRAALQRLSKDAWWVKNLIVGMVTDERPRDTTDEWCRNHLRVEMHEPRHRGDLCRRCYETKLDPRWAGTLPPPALLERWAKHPRTAESVVEDLMLAEVAKGKDKKRVDSNIRSARRPKSKPNQNRKAS